MGKTSIEWTDASWNPIVGCTEISPGCANCYAARLASTRLRNTPSYAGLAHRQLERHADIAKDPAPTYTGPIRWTGELRFLADRLQEPLRWRDPRKIFVCDMGDLFHEAVNDEWLSKIITIILKCPQHTFQILTKRPERMAKWFKYVEYCASRGSARIKTFPLPNVWLGVSVENRHFADERIPLLLNTPAAVRWVSAEPLLGPLGLVVEQGLDWVVCGGESGPRARPMHPDWARSLRDQCRSAGVPFFFKQWGQWLHATQMEAAFTSAELDALSRNTLCRDTGNGDLYFKVGKKRAGRQLDGSDWNQFPQVRP